MTPLFALLEQKWTMRIIAAIGEESRRFGQLQEELGVTPKILADRLRRLEELGVIVRSMWATIPPRVDYTLTERGRALLPPLRNLRGCCLADAHLLSNRTFAVQTT